MRGWWHGQAARLLTKRLAAITALELSAKVFELRDRYHAENLPFRLDVPAPTKEKAAEYASSPFIEQLKWVAATDDLLHLAITDFHRAYENRSRWSREGLLIPGELDTYEQRLVEEWRLAFGVMSALGLIDETDKQTAGLRLWREVSSVDVRIRPRFTERALTRGTYHGLADTGAVGWHPEFQDRLRQLLEAA